MMYEEQIFSVYFVYQIEIYLSKKYFREHIIPHLHDHRINKNIARAHLHCKRDCTTNYVDIIQYTHPRD